MQNDVGTVTNTKIQIQIFSVLENLVLRSRVTNVIYGITNKSEVRIQQYPVKVDDINVFNNLKIEFLHMAVSHILHS